MLTLLLFILLFLSGLALIIGFIKPKWIVLWDTPEKRTRKKVFVYFGLTISGSAILLIGLGFAWIISAMILFLFLGCIALISLFVGLIAPTKIVILGKQTRKGVLLQYSGLLVLILVGLGVIVGVGMADEEIDERVLSGEYAGERQGEIKHGEGKIANSSTSYEGSWANDQRNGFGTEVVDLGLAVNYKYEGNWKDDRKHGQGTETGKILWIDVIYEGEYKNGLRDGYGKYIDRKGNIYQGEWKDDLPYGEGEMILTNGEKYVGQVNGWTRHGYGKATLKDGTVMEGEWVDNELVE
ncbi:hypothetical protein GH741_01100 [Aquibacillus halophilus]|uniref:Uncharacterized protein n=1 Tax=Aquibacillus halophilus TaxID=930132 RepID=A0A6A8DEC2_9BACI|nr:hypothetical protein [Aquibacillus halophilus]MRH41267.1 hypothetical protein [Aquibacillus halophilus]